MSFYERSGNASKNSGHRRTWDTDEYKIKANERLTREREEADKKGGKGKRQKQRDDEFKPPPPKKLLEARDDRVDLDSKINKQVVINKTSTSADTGGFYCDICDCILKDSINYLDHINGKSHQRNMGYTMKVKRSTVDEIREKLSKKKFEALYFILKKEKSKKDDTLDEQLKEEQAKMSDLKRQKKAKKKPQVQEEETDPNSDLYALMGLSGFGGSKKNN
ncbi:Matrin-type domain-containing protein [Aphelenchoides bicaudatus]|nr:Matrin-type domain-containing protein [Aphelenchoides bicaudatus]